MNIGCDEMVTLNQLGEMVISFSGKKLPSVISVGPRVFEGETRITALYPRNWVGHHLGRFAKDCTPLTSGFRPKLQQGLELACGTAAIR